MYNIALRDLVVERAFRSAHITFRISRQIGNISYICLTSSAWCISRLTSLVTSMATAVRLLWCSDMAELDRYITLSLTPSIYFPWMNAGKWICNTITQLRTITVYIMLDIFALDLNANMIIRTKWSRFYRPTSEISSEIISLTVYTLRPKQHDRNFPDDIFKCIFLNDNVWISLRFHWSLFPRVQLTIFQHWFR